MGLDLDDELRELRADLERIARQFGVPYEYAAREFLDYMRDEQGLDLRG